MGRHSTKKLVGGVGPLTATVRSFNQYCDFSRQYDPKTPRTLPNGTQVPPYNGPGMSDFIREFGRFDLLDYSACASRWFPWPI